MSATLPAILDRAAELYIEDNEAQHGDLEQARDEARLWFRLIIDAIDAVTGERDY